ncbi:MAG: hypothetical protein ACP5G0_12980 [Desulfomonilia bacterium]
MSLHVNPGAFSSGSLVLKEPIPSLAVGRHVVVTVLSSPKDGLVLVSMFGKHLLVETTLHLKKGDVLNLTVHETSPRVILKQEQTVSTVKHVPGDIGSVLERLVGKFSEASLKSFDLREILARISTESSDEAGIPRLINAMLDQITQVPDALIHLLIPLVDRDSQGHARVSVTRDGQAFMLHFLMDTDHLGTVECVARMDDLIDAEIRSGSREVVDLFQEHLPELHEHLVRFGVRRLEVLYRSPEADSSRARVDVVV